MIERIALTGAPGSGKSSVIRTLEYTWYERTIPEAAEDMIKTLRKKGYEKPWELPNFQDMILELQIQREDHADQLPARVFIDRGILDGLAYYQIQNREPSPAMKKAIKSCQEWRYSSVFLIELGNSCEKNGIRRENMDEALKLQELQYRNYTEAGYKVERIPFIGIEERTNLILDTLGLTREIVEPRK